MGKIARKSDYKIIYNYSNFAPKKVLYFSLQKAKTGYNQILDCFDQPAALLLVITHKIADGDKKYFLFLIMIY